MPYHRRRHRSTPPIGKPARYSSAGTSLRLVRSVVVLLIGIWFGAILLVSLAVPQSFASVDEVMNDPPSEASRVFQIIGPVSARSILRYQIAEANRKLFVSWGWAQFAMAIVLMSIFVFAMPFQRFSFGIVSLMLLLATVMKFLLVPRIQEITRRFELNTGSTTIPDRDHFQVLHQGFSAFELSIVVLGGILLWRLLSRVEMPHRPAVAPDEPLTPSI